MALGTNYGTYNSNYQFENPYSTQISQNKYGSMSAAEFANEINSVLATNPQTTATSNVDTFTGSVQSTEDTTANTTDKSNDGKFSFLEFGKNFLGGVVDGAVNMVKGIVAHPVKSLLVGGAIVGAALVAGPVVLPILAAAGVGLAAISAVPRVVSSVGCAITGDWDGLEQSANGLGQSTLEVGLAVAGAKGAFSASSALGSVDDAAKVAAGSADDSVNILTKTKELFLTADDSIVATSIKTIGKAVKSPVSAYKYVKANGTIKGFLASGADDLLSSFSKAAKGSAQKLKPSSIDDLVGMLDDTKDAVSTMATSTDDSVKATSLVNKVLMKLKIRKSANVTDIASSMDDILAKIKSGEAGSVGADDLSALDDIAKSLKKSGVKENKQLGKTIDNITDLIKKSQKGEVISELSDQAQFIDDVSNGSNKLLNAIRESGTKTGDTTLRKALFTDIVNPVDDVYNYSNTSILDILKSDAVREVGTEFWQTAKTNAANNASLLPDLLKKNTALMTERMSNGDVL